MNRLLVAVRFYEGRYHGLDKFERPEWPPSPARVFQALVSGAAVGRRIADEDQAALLWLEALRPPLIAAPLVWNGQRFTTFVPTNERDKIERGRHKSEKARLSALAGIRIPKRSKPLLFDERIPLLYFWQLPGAPADEQAAETASKIAERLYQLGRTIDLAYACGEVLPQERVEERLAAYHGRIYRPSEQSGGLRISVPFKGALEQLIGVQWDRRSIRQKPKFPTASYDTPFAHFLFDIRPADDSTGFAPQPLERAVALTETVRDLAVNWLKASAWRRDDPKRETLADKIFIGRDSQEADKARRIRIAPLPSIGHAQTERSIRRVLVAVPPDCPIATGDIAWAFSGLVLVDPETGEVRDDTAELVTASDDTMLAHYGIKDSARLWRTVTPAALPERAARRRIDPHRMHDEAKSGAERLRENAVAERALIQSLRHAGIEAPVQTIRVQREPFDAKGQRAEAFAASPRFVKERLWHAEIGFRKPVRGPVLIGDGRYLGLGLMAPVRQTEGVFAFEIAGGLADDAEPLELTRALRRAIMSRVQAQLGPRATLPVFFTGHVADGAPARSGGHEHLAFAFDAPRRRLIVLSPHVFEKRDSNSNERRWLAVLEQALEDFAELRAGRAGKLTIIPCAADFDVDPLFGTSSIWASVTPYRVTRHAKLKNAAAAVEDDLLAECRRCGLPRPQVKIERAAAKPGDGLFGHVSLRFHCAVNGPLLLGRDRHFGGGLFAAAD